MFPGSWNFFLPAALPDDSDNEAILSVTGHGTGISAVTDP